MIKKKQNAGAASARGWILVMLAALMLSGIDVYPVTATEAGEVFSSSDEAMITRLPARYSLIDEGKKPKVRSQGDTGTCWAISAVSAIESDLLPQQEMVFSADHMSLSNGFVAEQEDGGDYYMIMSYLSDWKGPVLEAEDPYGDGVSPQNLVAAVHVQEVRLLRNLPRNAVKRMILKYGAAQSSLCLNRERTDTDEFHYYNALTGAYFDPLMEELDHDILILGWDDNYPKENFRIEPPGDGAWICQNTWGESFGEDGVFYVSYQDRNLLRNGCVAYNRIEEPDNYDHVYENDLLGWQGRQGYGEDGCWFAGVYTAGEDSPAADTDTAGEDAKPVAGSDSTGKDSTAAGTEAAEELAAVGLYSTGPGTECRVYVIPDFKGEEDLGSVLSTTLKTEEGSEAPSETESSEQSEQENGVTVIPAASASLDTAGFFTIDLDQSIPLEAGEQFAVVVWIRTEGEEKPVAVEMRRDRYTENVTLEGRQTWISEDGKIWDRTQTVYGTNVCLKAYTRS